MNVLWTLLQDAFFAAVPAVGFAMVFNVPRGALGYCALGGAVGHSLRFALTHYAGMPIEWATLLAATLISFVGIRWAQTWRAHPKVFTVAAMIPMIPGTAAFTALIALIEIDRTGFTPELFATFLHQGLRAFFIVSALAVGLAAPGLLLYRHRPVV
ncbi:MAG: threonine/serine exporter family protein [Nibricoccus sp.]